MKILLIRHTEQEYPCNYEGKQLVATAETPLSQTGEKQAYLLADELSKLELVPDAIFFSPYLRTLQTAKILKESLGVLNFETVNDLREVDPNESEGHTLEELEAIGSDVYAHPFGPNQETLEHLVARQAKAFGKIYETAQRRGFKTIGIVSHGDPLAAMYWAIRNGEVPESYAEMKKDYYPKKGEALEFTYENGAIQGEIKRVTAE